MLVSIDYALLARFIEIGVFGMAFVYTIVGFAIWWSITPHDDPKKNRKRKHWVACSLVGPTGTHCAYDCEQPLIAVNSAQ